MSFIEKHFLKQISVLLVVFMILTLSWRSLPPCRCGKMDSQLKINEAEKMLRGSFKSVLEAEEAGANVSGLMAKLNEAGNYLAEAKNAYKIGDFGHAESLADKCMSTIKGIENEASYLKLDALAKADLMFRVKLIFSLLEVAAFSLFMLIAWRWFRRKYIRKLMKMKPEAS